MEDQFDIRYNPADHGENNSLGSSGGSGIRIATLTTYLLALFLLAGLLMRFLHRL